MNARIILSIVVAAVAISAQAMTEKVAVLRQNAYFLPNSDNTLFQSLDLKRVKIGFANGDFESCASKMVRINNTLHYSCILTLPMQARISRRHNQITPVVMTIPYAGQDRKVYITVSDDAEAVTYATEFDMVGFDLEITTFNDDFYNIYAKSAANVIAEAMKKSLVMEVLESHDKKLAKN